MCSTFLTASIKIPGSNSSTDCEPGGSAEKPFQAGEVMHVASGDEAISHNNGAISHKSCSDPEKIGTKKRPMDADHGKTAKIVKHELVFQEAPATAQKLQCIFVDG